MGPLPPSFIYHSTVTADTQWIRILLELTAAEENTYEKIFQIILLI